MPVATVLPSAVIECSTGTYRGWFRDSPTCSTVLAIRAGCGANQPPASLERRGRGRGRIKRWEPTSGQAADAAPPCSGEGRLLADNRFAVLFGVDDNGDDRTEYRLIDAAGSVLASASFPDLPFGPAAEPLRIGDSVLWVAGRPDSWTNEAFVFGLDTTDATNPELIT